MQIWQNFVKNILVIRIMPKSIKSDIPIRKYKHLKMSKSIKTDIQIRKYKHFKAWWGKLHKCTHASQQAPKIHFRSTIISYLEHTYSTPRSWTRKTFNNFKLIN